MRVSYSVILDALGFYVERAGGSDVLVQELAPEGYLLAFLAGDEQEVVTFESDEIEGLHDEAQHQPVHPDGPSRRRHLRAAGCYLDGRGASAIVVQERLNTYTVDFTGGARHEEYVSDRGRLHVMLDDRQLQESEQRVFGPERPCGALGLCPRCGALNLGGRYYCRTCAAPLIEGALPECTGRSADGAGALPDTARALTLTFANGQSYRLEDNEAIVGCAQPREARCPDLDVTLYGGPRYGVARRHARLARVRAGFVVMDLGSTNGTFVNGHRALRDHPVLLSDRDRLAFGALEVVVSII